HRGHAMSRRWCEAGVPGHLTVIVGVQIDETRGYNPALGIDLVGAGTGHLPHLGDATILDGDISLEPRFSTSVDDGSPADYQIKIPAHTLLLNLCLLTSIPLTARPQSQRIDPRAAWTQRLKLDGTA